MTDEINGPISRISLSFNDAANKVVNFDELREKKFDVMWKNFTVKEKLFDAFINTPYNMFLFVRRGMEEAYQTIRGREQDRGGVYTDKISGDLFLDRASVDSDVQYALKHGLGKKFQEKAARLAYQAFDESRDFSVLVKSGQLCRCEF
ncbi:MAG: hypothetical protein PW788_09480 [Micavibrio sp.]|nr:hypothetical protein [Micavibrio sp.]